MKPKLEMIKTDGLALAIPPNWKGTQISDTEIMVEYHNPYIVFRRRNAHLRVIFYVDSAGKLSKHCKVKSSWEEEERHWAAGTGWKSTGIWISKKMSGRRRTTTYLSMMYE